uniref:Monooxygenase, DBH-like 1, like n=1 Tax=Salmo trutta TaxID=8032 RepID=A0A674DDF7_SALTR
MIHLFFSLLLAWTPGTGAQQDTLMPFMAHLDPKNNVNLKWGFSDVQVTITFQLTVKTTGWVGFRLRVQVTSVCVFLLQDYHATGNSFPLVDEKQSYTLLSLTEADGQTTMTFWRSIQSCDQEDFHITDSPVKTRGTKEVNLLKFMPRSKWTGHTDGINTVVPPLHFIVPAEHTYYNCKVMKMPKLNGKDHMYRVNDPSCFMNLDLVHHMLLYSCPLSVIQINEQQCYTGGPWADCFKVVAVWAVGGLAFQLPENAGIPIGGQDYDEFYRLEIHYHNLAQETGRRDSSGMRLYYTDQLRQHDVGIIDAGLMVSSWGYAIPPTASTFRSYGLCNTFVLDLTLCRNGTQIDFLAVDENYNFEMQGSISSLQGDEIVVECTYKTATREGITQLGLATTDEMCLAFIIYPAISVDHCWSQPNMHAYTAMMGKTDYHASVNSASVNSASVNSASVNSASVNSASVNSASVNSASNYLYLYIHLLHIYHSSV